MTARFIVGIVALAGVSVCGLLASLATFELVDKVNDNLPREEQFAPLGWYLFKYQRLNREYKRLYPDGRQLVKVRVLTALMFVFLLISAWGFGFKKSEQKLNQTRPSSGRALSSYPFKVKRFVNYS